MQIFEVSEYLCAAALRASGAKIMAIVPGERRCKIIFDDTNGTASDLAAQHRAGTLEVNSRAMADAVQSVKSEIFGARRD